MVAQRNGVEKSGRRMGEKRIFFHEMEINTQK
jgi:hypothetical protein